MITYEYKLQGNGKPSWKATETDEFGNVVNIYMVYEEPNKKRDISNIDVDTLTAEELQKLANRLKPLL
jgi:hypothetical protein